MCVCVCVCARARSRVCVCVFTLSTLPVLAKAYTHHTRKCNRFCCFLNKQKTQGGVQLPNCLMIILLYYYTTIILLLLY